MTTLEDYRKRFKGKGDGQNMPPDVQGRYDQVQTKMGQPGFGLQSATGGGGGPTDYGNPIPLIGPPSTAGGDTRDRLAGPPPTFGGGGQQYQGPPQQQPPWGYAPQQQQMGPTSIYDVFNSAVPLMNANRDKQIGQSMAQAGLQGTRFGTAAQNNAARIGADTALQQDQLLTNLLYQQGQSDADRQLQATGQAMNLAQIYDQMQRSRIDQLSQIGMWEQGRGDVLNQMPYQDWMQSRMGYLPQVLQALGSGNVSPTPQNPISTTTPAGQGLADYAMLAAMIYGMVSDARLKDNITRMGNGMALWTWKHSGELGVGMIAQDLEKYRPDLVIEAGGIKHVKYIGG